MPHWFSPNYTRGGRGGKAAFDCSQLSAAVLNTKPVYIASVTTLDLTGKAEGKQKGESKKPTTPLSA